MSRIEQLNQSLFLLLNASANTAQHTLRSAAFIADDLIYVIPLTLLAMWLWGGRRDRSAALEAVLVTLVALCINQVLALLWPHPRPFMIPIGHTFIAHASDPSFPSDHATVFAGVGLTFILARCRLLLGCLILCVGVGVAWSRVFLGVHFPLDMVGAAGSALCGYGAVSPVWRRFGEGLAAWASIIYRNACSWPIAKGWVRA